MAIDEVPNTKTVGSASGVGSSSGTAQSNGTRTALILARGGSKGIPYKNIKPLQGVPLICWAATACLQSGVFDDVVVSTDCPKISEVAKKCGATVFNRDPKTAIDTATSESGIKDYLDRNPQVTTCCLVQATSPLVSAEDIRKAHQMFVSKEADSLVTVVRWHRFFWKLNDGESIKNIQSTGSNKSESAGCLGLGAAVNYDPRKRPRRQEWSGELMENGALYIFTRACFEKYNSRLGDKTAIYEMSEETQVELDSLVDWKMVECLMAAKKYQYLGLGGYQSEYSNADIEREPRSIPPSVGIGSNLIADV